MSLKLSFVVFAIPSLIYYLAQRQREMAHTRARTNLGFTGGHRGYVLSALVLGAMIPLLFFSLSRYGLVGLDFSASRGELVS